MQLLWVAWEPPWRCTPAAPLGCPCSCRRHQEALWLQLAQGVSQVPRRALQQGQVLLHLELLAAALVVVSLGSRICSMWWGLVQRQGARPVVATAVAWQAETAWWSEGTAANGAQLVWIVGLLVAVLLLVSVLLWVGMCCLVVDGVCGEGYPSSLYQYSIRTATCLELRGSCSIIRLNSVHSAYACPSLANHLMVNEYLHGSDTTFGSTHVWATDGAILITGRTSNSCLLPDHGTHTCCCCCRHAAAGTLRQQAVHMPHDSAMRCFKQLVCLEGPPTPGRATNTIPGCGHTLQLQPSTPGPRCGKGWTRPCRRASAANPSCCRQLPWQGMLPGRG
jgi:hypothetical protein